MGIKKILARLSAPLTPLNRMIPKKKRLVLIYSNLGFRDNAKSIYDYMITRGFNKKYKIVCAADNYRMYRRSAPENVKFISPGRALWSFLRCRYMFYSFGKFPILPAKKQTVVNLWHGMPLKTIGALEKGSSYDGKCYFDYTIATSLYYQKIMQRCFGVGSGKVLLTGQPRCDKLFEGDRKCKKMILWLPTYRSSSKLGSTNSSFKGGEGFPLADSSEKLAKLDSLLGELGYKLFIKPHPMQDIGGTVHGYENIIFTTQHILDKRGMDIYDLMKKSCALITDYSSSYFDYLLLDRPIGFTLDDFDKYRDDRGFVTDDPLALMPGDRLYTFADLENFIRRTAACRDDHRIHRSDVNKMVNSHQTGGASERILDIIGLKM
ncbi:MAG: CDP-glycerol glycerophosphotransferase family protein [Ruminococcus sp.]|nr:CDP-glycerol glycerophosphotransferase family protein [Ruminococcus sp.]